MEDKDALLVNAARRILRGDQRIARMLTKLAAKYGKRFTYRVVRLKGEPAVLEYASGHLFAATFCDIDGDRFSAMYRVLNPEKLTHVAAQDA